MILRDLLEIINKKIIEFTLFYCLGIDKIKNDLL